MRGHWQSRQTGRFGRFGLVATILLAAGMAVGQVPDGSGPGRSVPGQAPPGYRPPPQGLQAESAVPDTITIRFSVPDSLPAPAAVHIVQDTLDFGGPLYLVCDYPRGITPAYLPPPEPNGQWLEPVAPLQPGPLARLFGRSAGPEVDLGDLAPTTGTRLVHSYRVYRRDPLRLAWSDEVSSVLTVRGRTGDSVETATIRDPRPLGWTPWRLIIAGIVLVVLALAVVAWWRRRTMPPPLPDWEVLPPPWLAAAIGLQKLVDGRVLARGDTRRFLDKLAGLARDYVAGRYRVAAREMTGREIVSACVARGYSSGHPAGFARLIELADRERYNPDRPDAAFCREQAVQLFGRLNRVRIAVRHVRVAPDLQRDADRAWRNLERELGTGAGREVGAVSHAGEDD